jgi:hypothetical protein
VALSRCEPLSDRVDRLAYGPGIVVDLKRLHDLDHTKDDKPDAGNERLPNSSIALIDAGQLVWEDAPDDYAALVTGWWTAT